MFGNDVFGIDIMFGIYFCCFIFNIVHFHALPHIWGLGINYARFTQLLFPPRYSQHVPVRLILLQSSWHWINMLDTSVERWFKVQSCNSQLLTYNFHIYSLQLAIGNSPWWDSWLWPWVHSPADLHPDCGRGRGDRGWAGCYGPGRGTGPGPCRGKAGLLPTAHTATGLLVSLAPGSRIMMWAYTRAWNEG